MQFGRSLFLAAVVGACLAFAVPALATPNGYVGQAATAAVPFIPAFQPADLSVFPTDNWPVVGGNYQQDHYSALSQINTGNVASLKEAWHIHLDGSGTAPKFNDEATPLIWGGVMFIPTGNNDVFAIDAATGNRIWTHLSNQVQNNNTVCCGWDARGLAIGQGLVFSAQLDGKLVALDAQTGNIVWAASNARWQDGYTMTMAPLYYNGLVIVGVSGSEFGARGSMTAYNAKTGHRVWRFYTTPTPGDIGSGTWPNNTEWAHGGATIWNTPSVDYRTGIMTFTTANADPWSSRGPGDDLFTSTMVALDAMTGEYAWHFQITHHDIWDYDCPSPTFMYDAVYGGVASTAVAEACKTGWMYVINAHDGNPLLEIDEKPVPQNAFQNTSATQPTPVGDAFSQQCPDASAFSGTAPDGQPFIVGCIWTPFDDKQFTAVAPGASGGNNWSPPSYNPTTGFSYLCSGNSQFGYKAIPNASSLYVGGRAFVGLQFAFGATATPTSGDFTAMNTLTNRIAWKQHYTAPGQAGGFAAANAFCTGGSLSTAGNLVFTGVPAALANAFVAYNAATGQEVWRVNLDAAVNSPASTATINGKQYLFVYADGRTTVAPPGVKGDSVYAYTLG
jgi:PQQ-dependent dehydrogenase (methanol/ethanol family)